MAHDSLKAADPLKWGPLEGEIDTRNFDFEVKCKKQFLGEFHGKFENQTRYF